MKRSKRLLNLICVIAVISFISCKKEIISEQLLENSSTAANKPSGGGKITSKPTVSFIYPLNGNIVSGTIVIKISASSPIGIKNTSLIETVGTFNCLSGNDNTAPYEYTWNTDYICLTRVLPGQQVTLRATATDSAGNLNFTDITVTKQ
ncbi:MAG TPA: Ig-like domain-containing protein [Chitinophagaceae bacterium]|nr:Ig-like domain-containing protein [Chitinophagaceae bacterium]